MTFPIIKVSIITGVSMLIIVPLISYLKYRAEYNHTEYRFYDNYLEYTEGFGRVHEKSINYSNITEVNLEKGIIERLFGRGMITLSTPASPTKQNDFSGIEIMDLDNVDVLYSQVNEIVSKAAK